MNCETMTLSSACNSNSNSNSNSNNNNATLCILINKKEGQPQDKHVKKFTSFANWNSMRLAYIKTETGCKRLQALLLQELPTSSLHTLWGSGWKNNVDNMWCMPTKSEFPRGHSAMTPTVLRPRHYINKARICMVAHQWHDWSCEPSSIVTNRGWLSLNKTLPCRSDAFTSWQQNLQAQQHGPRTQSSAPTSR